MKKLILFFAILFGVCFIANVQAQKLALNEWSYAFTGVAATDFVDGTATTWTKSIDVSSPYSLNYVAQVKLSDKTSNATATVAFKGKNFATDAYTTITTTTWYGGGTDTTIVFTSNQTKVNYNYFQVTVTRTAASANINWFKFITKK